MFHHQAFQLYASMAAHTPMSARTHHPPTVPVNPRLLLPTLALRVSLPLSPSLSLLPSLSLSLLLSGPPPTVSHSLSLSLSLSRIKGFSGCSVGLYPPRGSNPPPQDRRGAVYPLCYDELLSALLFRPFLLPPACHPLSGISPFAWGCAQQRVEEPHSVSGYRVRLPEERSLGQP